MDSAIQKWKTYTTIFGKKLKVVFRWGFVPLVIWIGMSVNPNPPSLLSVFIPFLVPPEITSQRMAMLERD